MALMEGGSPDDNPLWAFRLALEPDRRISGRVALPGHKLEAALNQVIAHNLHGDILDFPR